MTAVDDETAESVLRDIWRERFHAMGRRDGFDGKDLARAIVAAKAGNPSGPR